MAAKRQTAPRRDRRSARAGYFQIESASHAIFYRKTDTGILIVRVLHERMDFKRHL
jgi:toxin ParE1/3/4